MRILAGLFASAVLFVAGNAFAQSDPAEEVIQAEQAFDAYTAEHGITQGFHAYSAPEAIAFWPRATRIHDLLGQAIASGEGGKDAPSKLRWRPYAVSVATTGDMAWDYGPWTVDGTTDAGWFFTVWQKQADGKWLWLIDTRAGYDNPKALPAADARIRHNLKAMITNAAGIAGALDNDNILNTKLKTKTGPESYGVQMQFATFASDKGQPTRGMAERNPHVLSRPAGQGWTRGGHGASSGGDMVYVWGHTEDGQGSYTGHYVRVWRKVGPQEGTWLLEFDVHQSVKN